MELRIASYLAASHLLTLEPEQWHAIVILDSGSMLNEFVGKNSLSHLVLRFDDIEESRDDKLLPTRDSVVQALSFAREKENLIVTCRAGQGRSAALAYLIASQASDTRSAILLLDPKRHKPNRLVIALGDAELLRIGTLEQFDAWRREHQHVKLSDYYDDLLQEVESLEALGATNRICY